MLSLNDEVIYIKGVGTRRANDLAKLNIVTVRDLLFHIPRTYIDRKMTSSIADIETENRYSINLQLLTVSLRPMKSGKKQLQAIFTDGEFRLQCIWFNWAAWQKDALIPGQEYWLDGEVTAFGSILQMVHPNFELLNEKLSTDNAFWHDRQYLPVYPLTENIRQNYLRKLIQSSFEAYQHLLFDTLPPYLYEQNPFPDLKTALSTLHFPLSLNNIDIARNRLVFEELLYHQLMFARVYYRSQKQINAISFINKKDLTTKVKQKLSFELTTAQKRCIREIFADMQAKIQMNRLIQGDVGSGKTIVALFAMLLAVENGCKAVFLVPTEILARQHYQNISNLLSIVPQVKTALIIGGTGKEKEETISSVLQGDYDIVIGTHALLEKRINVPDIGLVVIDEQQRFGVRQRAVLPAKGNNPDVLFLTATPIPRTLALSVYGDLDISLLDELPAFRKKVDTIWKQSDSKYDIYEHISQMLAEKKQAYIVCPLKKESKKIDLLDAENLYLTLKDGIFKNTPIALVHSDLKSAEKEAIMTDFQSNKIALLVSTTVIEVGVDVPNASIMLVEHAERFGLSQLHQLRGRVGRGSDKAYCYLISYPPLSKIARERLTTMIKTNNGFVIAEKDLELRGPGEFFGTLQSGLPVFKFADIVKDKPLVSLARDNAFQIIKEDYALEKQNNGLIKKRYFEEYHDKEKLFFH